MFATTHTPVARWVVVNANDKRSGQINAVMHALLYDGTNPEVTAPPDPAIEAPPNQAECSRPRVNAAGRR